MESRAKVSLLQTSLKGFFVYEDQNKNILTLALYIVFTHNP